MSVKVSVVLSRADLPLSFFNVSEITFIDNETHGTAPANVSIPFPSGRRRLIISSPNVATVLIEGE